MTPIEKDHGRGLNGALAAEIRAELAVRDRTTTWLAERAQMDRLTLRRYLKAERAMNTAIVEAVAEALGVDPGDLMAQAVARRDRYPELYGPHATDLTVHLAAHGGESAIDRRRAMQQIEDEAARDEKPAKPMPDPKDHEAVEQWLDED